MFDERTCMFYGNSGRVYPLTRIEGKILSILLECKKSVAKYETFAMEVWHDNEVTDSVKNVLRHHIKDINSKLQHDLRIKAKPTIGYYIEGK